MSGLQRRLERESLLEHPTSDKYFKQVRIPMTNARKFKAKNEDEDEDRRIRAAQREKDPYLETEVKAGDTLHTLSLRFNIPVAELKRVNNIISDNEFFALKRIKIPVKPLSFLAEQLCPPEIHPENPEASPKSEWKVEHFSSPPTSSEISSPPLVSDESGDNLGSNQLVETSKSQNRQVRKTRKFLRSVDKDIAVVKQKNRVIKSTVIGGSSSVQEGWDEADLESQDEEEEQDLLGLNNRSESVLLLPSKHSVNVTRPPPGSKLICFCCVALVVIAVIVILCFSEYEYEAIEHKDRNNQTLRT